MIYIAICDDSCSDAEKIEAALLKLQPLYEEKLTTSIYYSGAHFSEAIKDGCVFDIILMDIEMTGMDGIAVGELLRADDQNDMVLLIYISSHEHYYRQLLDIQPYGFLEKPIVRDIFREKLNKAISKVIRRRQDGKRQVLPILQNSREILIPYQRILYLESKVRQILLYTTEESLTYYGKLYEEEQKLDPLRFVRTHQSYIVNLQQVRVISRVSLRLSNQTEIPISNSRKEKVKKSYMEYRRNYFE